MAGSIFQLSSGGRTLGITPPLEHFYESLPGWFDFADLYAEQVKRAPSGAHFVEVGTYAGKSAAFMAVDIANSGKQIQFDACDTFEGVERKFFPDESDYLAQEALRDADGLMVTAARANLAPVADVVTVRVGDSLALAESYADASLDFVFLDDDHSTPHLLKELAAWYPKVKPGGVLAGHDLNWPSVQAAVEPWSQMQGLAFEARGHSSWLIEKPSARIELRVKAGKRRCLVAVCSNERSIYRQTAGSLMQLGWGSRVTKAATKHGFEDVQFAWINDALLVSDLRNKAVEVARAQQCTHILFLDADMTWPADVLDRMLAHHDKGIVSGLYFMKTWPHWPVALTRPRVNPQTLQVDYDYDKTAHDGESLMPESLVGMGCTLVPMSVFDGMAAPWFEYRQDLRGVWSVTEDVPFCQKASALGCPIYVDPTVKCGHIGQLAVSEPWYQRSLCEIAMLEDRNAAIEQADREAKVPA